MSDTTWHDSYRLPVNVNIDRLNHDACQKLYGSKSNMFKTSGEAGENDSKTNERKRELSQVRLYLHETNLTLT